MPDPLDGTRVGIIEELRRASIEKLLHPRHRYVANTQRQVYGRARHLYQPYSGIAAYRLALAEFCCDQGPTDATFGEVVNLFSVAQGATCLGAWPGIFRAAAHHRRGESELARECLEWAARGIAGADGEPPRPEADAGQVAEDRPRLHTAEASAALVAGLFLGHIPRGIDGAGMVHSLFSSDIIERRRIVLVRGTSGEVQLRTVDRAFAEEELAAVRADVRPRIWFNLALRRGASRIGVSGGDIPRPAQAAALATLAGVLIGPVTDEGALRTRLTELGHPVYVGAPNIVTTRLGAVRDLLEELRLPMLARGLAPPTVGQVDEGCAWRCPVPIFGVIDAAPPDENAPVA